MEAAIVVSAVMLATAVVVFVVRYASRAPWWRSLEGRTIVGTMSTFFLILVNLAFYRATRWSGYEAALVVLLLAGTGFMVSQNVVLTRARKRAARRRTEGTG